MTKKELEKELIATREALYSTHLCIENDIKPPKLNMPYYAIIASSGRADEVVKLLEELTLDAMELLKAKEI